MSKEFTLQLEKQNIERSFGLREAKKHQDDATSVSLWVQEMAKSKVNPVLLFKTQGQNPFSECPSLKNEDFMLVIQTPNQKQLLQTFGSNIVCMDDTHGTNTYDFSLITVLVVDEFGEGCPVAWCLCNRTDLYIPIDFLMAVKENVGKMTPQWVMTDDAEQYYKAWVAVFGLGPHKLLCTWHVDRAWRNAIKGIIDKEIAALVYHNIRVLLEESNPETFQIMLTKTLAQLNECAETKEFCKYFTIHYSKRAKEWAACYRKAANINTNMYIESFHRTLKYIYFKGRINKRIDNLIHILMKVSRDKAFDRLCKLEKGKISARLVTIRKRHLASTKLPQSLVTKQSQREWIVQSADKQNQYSVVLDLEQCPTKCRILCADCKTCIHMYSCTCMDYIINHTIFKHIHLTATCATESKQDKSCSTPTAKRVILTKNEGIFQQENKLLNTKNTIYQMLSRIHVLTEKCSSLHELKLVAKHLTSAENIFESTKQPLIPSNSVIPSNSLIKAQRFHSTRKRKKNPTLRLAKPTHKEKQVVRQCLEHNTQLYQSRDGSIQDKLRLFCHDDTVEMLTADNVIQLSQLKSEFFDEVIEVDMKTLKKFFSEQAWLTATEKVSKIKEMWKCSKCDEIKYIDMVMCDDCHLWFHWSCSNYKGESNEEWFCSSCTKAKRIHSETHIPIVAHKDNVNEFPFHDQNMVDQSPSLLRFYRTGAERHQLSPDDEEDIELTTSGEYGLSIDADVALWLEKRHMDGKQDLEKAGADSFIIVTSALHTEFDKFKDEYKQYTRRGFSMLPKNELLHYWNETRASPSSSLDLFSNTYFLLECTEIDKLCDWIETVREDYHKNLMSLT